MTQAARGGIDLGGTKIEAIVADDQNKVLGSARHPTPQEGGPEAVVEALATALRQAAQEAEIDPGKLQGVGVGSPGLVDQATGSVSSARNIPGWEGKFALAEKLAGELGTRVHVGNDVQVATEAEFELGAGKPFQSLLGVFWGTGVGGGLILDGKAWTGRGGAGEIGHTVVKLDGARCTCGRQGCLEAYAGRASMEARARHRLEQGHKTKLFEIMEEKGKTRLTSGIWERALKHEDKVAEEIFEQAIAALGAGVASAVNLLDVEAVVVGGGLGVRFGQEGADRIATAMAPHLFSDDRPPAVAVAALGDLGGALGAALLAR